jgi:DNA ligase 1
MLLADVAAVSDQVAETSRRLEKIELLAGLVGRMSAGDARIAVSWLTGDLPQRQIGVGWAALRSPPPVIDIAGLTVAEVDERFGAIKAATGPGSQTRRRDLLADLLARCTDGEQAFLRGLLSGGLRQGALAGVMVDAIARAARVPVAQVRRAAMLTGDLAGTAVLALTAGSAGLASVHLQVGRAVGPMLAQTAASTDDALARLGAPVLWQQKLDGIRIQAHKSGDHVALFTRTLDDVTARMPEVAAAVAALPARELVLDGEVIAIRVDGRPAPFQQTASRTGTRTGAARSPATLTFFPFDLLYLDGTDLLATPTQDRVSALHQIIDNSAAVGRIDQLITSDPTAARAFLAQALASGHEGVVAKSIDAPYEAGRRGAGWLKIKPVHSLDLVVLAVEWGSGRRKGWLSNIHLGALEGTRFVMLGKTFKGMTDEMLAWQTRRFTELAVGPTDGWIVELRPEQVVEIAFDGVQRSTRYPGGVALRFARVLRYRDDKSAADADTLDAVRGFLPD